ncbi:MAG: RNA polymerase sigma factor, partial [Planctomycetota bacterium]|nr:RNA polymerase sigma factor [Planctomycetota bacterium]
MQDHPRHFDPQLLLENVRWMQPLALRLVGDPDDADDVLQDTWVAAVSTRPATVRVHPSRWLTGVLRRVAARVHRDRATRVRHERVAVEASSVSDPTPTQLLERAEVQRVLLETVLALDEPYRSTILLRFFEDIAPREIARRYRLAVPTVKTRLRRGLKLLRPRVLDRLGDNPGRSLATLAAFATVAAGSNSAAAAGSGAGASTSFATTPTVHSYSWIGALAMSKSTLQAAAILVAVSIGFVSGNFVSRFSVSEVAPGATEDADLNDTGADPVLSASEFADMRSERDALKAR